MNGIDDRTLYAVVAAVVVALILVVLWLYVRGGRARTLRRQFGPEYEHTVRDAGSKRRAHEELEERLKRHEQLEIHALPAADRERYAQAWQQTQTRFVDAPTEAVREADTLVAEVMRARGYPVDKFDQRAADVSVDHPNVVQNYREAHAISEANNENRASTEDLRRALVHYRSLFNELLDAQEPAAQAGQTRTE